VERAGDWLGRGWDVGINLVEGVNDRGGGALWLAASIFAISAPNKIGQAKAPYGRRWFADGLV